jgi:hypothetical protein
MLDEEQQPSHDEVEEADEINCFGDENDSSFFTQVDYEEALMDHKIHEASIEESIYLTNDQKGYNLRSKNASPESFLAAPVKNKEVVALVKSKEVVAKQPAAHVKQTSSPAKQQ